MKLKWIVVYLLAATVLPVSSSAQVWFPDGSQAGEPFDMNVIVTFPTAGYSVTNYTVDVSGMNIDIRLFTPASTTGYVAQVISHEQVVIEIPALPEGKYTCHLTVSGKGTVYPDTIEFSVPQPAGSYIDDPYHFFGQNPPALMKANHALRYTHLQNNGYPNLQYITEARTNFSQGSWVPLCGATTNSGVYYNEISYDLLPTNSQLYIRTRVISVE